MNVFDFLAKLALFCQISLCQIALSDKFVHITDYISNLYNSPNSPKLGVARFPLTKYGRFLSMGSFVPTCQGPPTPIVYCGSGQTLYTVVQNVLFYFICNFG